MNIMPIILGSVIGVLWLVGCILLICKFNVKGKRASKITLSVILFIICTGLYVGAKIGAYEAEKAINQYAGIIQEYVYNNHSNVPFVRNGVELPDLPGAINELETMVPKLPDEFGLSGVFVVTMYQNAVSRGFDIMRSRSDEIREFTGEGNRVTVSLIISFVVQRIMSIVNNIVFWITFSAAAILGIVLVIFVILAFKKKK